MTHAKDIYTAIQLPFFSVIITSHNRASLLKRAVDSLTLQKENDWEAIIIDDGSTDNTQKQIAPYLKNNTITYHRQEKSGCVASKNTGTTLAKGKYITFLDSDDEYSPDHLACRKLILTENPGIDLLHGGIHVMGSPYVPDRSDHKKMVHLNNCVVGGTFFIKKELISRLKGFKEITLGHDADFFDRAVALGATIVKTDFPTYIYHREIPDSITNNLMTKASR
ncbi:MAG: glycosyltransferase family 2 protein [Chitinophagaceae bacterium]|nr:glycosyltransferase family 2 protein [Chitinophagaceae bacterium]